MSFFNSKPWAKIPTDLLENKAMIQAEKELGEEFRAAPVLLYLAGATKADEDGIFDIGDGREFAALIKTKSPETVFQVISVMVKCRIFAHVPKSTVYLFAEWEYSTRQTGKSLKNRFTIAEEIWKKKQEENSYFCPVYTKIDTLKENLDGTFDKCLNTIQAPVNECFNTIQPPENGIPQIRREEIREDQSRADQIIADVEQTTHTRVEGAGEESPPEISESSVDSAISGGERTQDVQQMPEDEERLMDVPCWSIVLEPEKPCEPPEADAAHKEKADAFSVPAVDEKKQGELENILTEFFVKNNAVYNRQKGAKYVNLIASELLCQNRQEEDVTELCRWYCQEFKKMHDSPKTDHWHNIPLFPLYMTKEAVWAQLTERVTRIHAAKYGSSPFSEQAYKAELADRQKNQEQRIKDIEMEYVMYGISPDDPNRHLKLIQKKKRGEQ